MLPRLVQSNAVFFEPKTPNSTVPIKENDYSAKKWHHFKKIQYSAQLIVKFHIWSCLGF